MIWVAIILLGLAVIALAMAVRATLRAVALGKVDHAKCVALISSVISNRVVARTVRELAERYETIDGQAELTRIRNTVYTSDGAGQVPAIWMREQADKIEREGHL